MAASLKLLDLDVYNKDGKQIVTGDKTWVKHVNCETKKNSLWNGGDTR